MRLYLSSFRLGDHPEHLLALAGQHSRRAVVIANAMDDAPPVVRRAGVEQELAALAGLGLDAAELDLRDYFGPRQLLRRDLAGTGVAWLRGGNAFVLRCALARSGADAVLAGLLAADALVPHYRSPGHPETAAIERVVARYRADGTPYRALHDGQALLINGPQTMIV